MVILIGIEKMKRKDSNELFYRLHFSETFEASEKNCEGSRSFSEYLSDLPDDLGVGCEVTLNYRKMGNFAKLISVNAI